MVLLNGAEGMSEMFAKALTMGGTGLGLARQLLNSMNAPAPVPAEAPAPAPVPATQVIPVQADNGN